MTNTSSTDCPVSLYSVPLHTTTDPVSSTNPTPHTGDFLAVAGIGMVITAQWELVLGNTYAYTVLGAFGFFYFGFGLIVTPLFGVADAYGGSSSPQYNNAIAFFVLLWAVFKYVFFRHLLS